MAKQAHNTSCQTTINSNFWKVCDAKVKQIASEYGIDCILYGSGSPVSKPNIVVVQKDALSGEGSGYNVYVYPDGDGYGKPYKYYSVDDGVEIGCSEKPNTHCQCQKAEFTRQLDQDGDAMCGRSADAFMCVGVFLIK